MLEIGGTIRDGLDEAKRQLRDLEALGVSVEKVCADLLREGVASFSKSFTDLLGAVETAVNKIGGDVFAVGPFAGGIGDNKRDVMSAKKREEFRNHECRMPDFDAMANRTSRVGLRPGAASHLAVVLLGQLRSFCRIRRND